MHRPLFEDGINSAAHVFFGLATPTYPVIAPLFVAYQLIHNGPAEMMPSIFEYALGVAVALLPVIAK